MSGILIYSAADAERNRFAVQKYIELLGASLVLSENLSIEKDKLPDFVINRTNDAGIAFAFEKLGVRVFNPAALSRLANDKQLCYEFMQKNGVPIMPVNYFDVPLVIKPKNGRGGMGVRLITNKNEIPRNDNLVYQKPASEPGRDLRVFMLGGSIAAAVLRENKTDLRANMCLGGSVSEYILSKQEKELVYSIGALIKHDFIGIDFVFDNNRIVFNEIEDSVGARSVYRTTGKDIIALYCSYIAKEMKRF
ncbi:MAG: ATP-grasp domain-containing protein [Clostridiales bacterium]|nr:ATP-grasp domain-containing protein [Clostridiales bacterium]